jgi:hypothetical protein
MDDFLQVKSSHESAAERLKKRISRLEEVRNQLIKFKNSSHFDAFISFSLQCTGSCWRQEMADGWRSGWPYQVFFGGNKLCVLFSRRNVVKTLYKCKLAVMLPILACSGYNSGAACPRKTSCPSLISMHTFNFLSEDADARSVGTLFQLLIVLCTDTF